MKVHAAGSDVATPEEALWRATLAPARALRLADRIGFFTPGRECAFIEIVPACDASFGSTAANAWHTATEAILHGVLGLETGELDGGRDDADPRSRAVARLCRSVFEVVLL